MVGSQRAFSVYFYSVSLYLLSSDLCVFFIALIPAIIVFGVLSRRIRKKAKKLMHNYQMSEWLQQRLLGVETIKAFRSEAQEIQQFEQISSNNFRNFLRIELQQQPKLLHLRKAIAVIAMVMVLYVSLIQVEKGVAGAVVLSFSVVASLTQSACKSGKYFNASREGRVALPKN